MKFFELTAEEWTLLKATPLLAAFVVPSGWAICTWIDSLDATSAQHRDVSMPNMSVDGCRMAGGSAHVSPDGRLQVSVYAPLADAR